MESSGGSGTAGVGRRDRRKRWWLKRMREGKKRGGSVGAAVRGKITSATHRGKRTAVKHTLSPSTAGFRPPSSGRVLGKESVGTGSSGPVGTELTTTSFSEDSSDDTEESSGTVHVSCGMQLAERGRKKNTRVNPASLTPKTTSNTAEKAGASLQTNEQGSKSSGKGRRYIAFIGNLPFTATSDDITLHFRKKGVVMSELRLLTDRESGQSRGCCFAEFPSAKILQNALKFHHTMMEGRRLNVEVTCGGGGKGQTRKRKIKERNEKLRRKKKRTKMEEQEKKNRMSQ